LENSVKVHRLIQVSPEIGKSKRFFTETSTVTGNSGSNPERAHGDKFFVCQRPNLATQ
jgi:hypothetical protein